MKRARSFVLMLALGIGVSTSARAESEWNYSFAPLFLWGMGIEGSTSIGPMTAPLDIRFKDALDNLEGMFTFHFEAQNRDLALFAEYQYVNLGPEAEVPLPGGNAAQIYVTFKNTMAGLGTG